MEIKIGDYFLGKTYLFKIVSSNSCFFQCVAVNSVGKCSKMQYNISKNLMRYNTSIYDIIHINNSNKKLIETLYGTNTDFLEEKVF